jgi:hypothetical protein
MPLLNPQLLSCSSVLRAEDNNMFRYLSSLAAVAVGGKHRGDSGLEEISSQAICSSPQLDSQQALCLPEPIMEQYDIGPQGGFTKVGVGRTFGLRLPLL